MCDQNSIVEFCGIGMTNCTFPQSFILTFHSPSHAQALPQGVIRMIQCFNEIIPALYVGAPSWATIYSEQRIYRARIYFLLGIRWSKNRPLINQYGIGPHVTRHAGVAPSWPTSTCHATVHESSSDLVYLRTAPAPILQARLPPCECFLLVETPPRSVGAPLELTSSHGPRAPMQARTATS